MKLFARLSGDLNPLHADTTFSGDKGFAGPVVYGGLIVAHVSRLLGMHLPGRDGLWTGLRIDFREPLYVGEIAEVFGRVVHLSKATRTVTVNLRVEARGRIVANGSAEASFLGDG